MPAVTLAAKTLKYFFEPRRLHLAPGCDAEGFCPSSYEMTIAGPEKYPTRFKHLDVARQRFGEARVERLGSFLRQGDPLADAAVEALSGLERAQREQLVEQAIRAPKQPGVPEALREVIAAAENLPVWWDPKRAAQGGQVLLRSNMAGGVVLAFKCLLGSYFSPAGNKVLMFTQRLEDDVTRRLAETGRFIRAMAEPDGLVRGTKAFHAAIRVRLVHAQVRRFLSQSPRWDHAAWGTPINQYDMSGTNLLFSHALADGLEQLGMRVSTDEREALLHLWRGVGHVLGVDAELLPSTERDARNQLELLHLTQDGPDDDSRRLVRAFLEEPIRTANTDFERKAAQLSLPLRTALARGFIGPETFDKLGLRSTPIAPRLPVMWQAIRVVGAGMRLNPVSEALGVMLGYSSWERLEQILHNVPNVFALPTNVAGLHPRRATSQIAST